MSLIYSSCNQNKQYVRFDWNNNNKKEIMISNLCLIIFIINQYFVIFVIYCIYSKYGSKNLP